MSVTTILIIVLILILFGAIPVWPHAQNWGYGPMGIIIVILLILLVLRVI